MMMRTRWGMGGRMVNDKNRPFSSSNGPLGELLRQAATGLDGIKDLATRGSQVGRAEVEVQLKRREHRRALAQLGQAVLDASDDDHELELPPVLASSLERARQASLELAAAQSAARQAWQPGMPRPADDDDDL
jgi:hypothetical protein